MSYQFTKEQRALAKKNNVPLVGFTIDVRHCDPPGIKTDISTGGADPTVYPKVRKLFLDWLKIAYVGRVKRMKKGVDHA